MILRRAASPSSLLKLPITPSPDASPCPSIFSAPSVRSWEDDAMSISSEHKTGSRPVSIAPPRTPSLREILANRAPPPYTLSAFAAYLSQKQCLENLEFTMDARRYAQRYDELSAEMTGIPMTDDVEDCKNLTENWLRLLDAYIMQGAPKEVNLPDHIRRELLKMHPDRSRRVAAPPAPEFLERAVEHIVELMDESIMMGFISDNAPKLYTHQHTSSNDFAMTGLESDDERRMRGGSRLNVAEQDRQRSRSRNYSPQLQSGESARLQTSFPPSTSNISNSSGLGLGPSASRGSVGSASGSAELTMVDEGSTPSSPSDLITPPTTPPGADIGGTSPRQNQNPWRKMMGKLGNKKRSASRMERER